ncbi:MAG TPA: hypothetical protein VF446_12690 [Trinickia sp.]
MTNSMRPCSAAFRAPDFSVGAGRMPHGCSYSTVVVHVQAGSPPPSRQAVVGIAAPPVARV